MPLSQIIVTSRYLKSGSARSVTKRKNYTKYIATRETVEKREQNQYDSNAATTEKQKEMLSELLSDFPEAKHYLEYEDYAAHPTVQNASELITTIIERHADVIGNRQNFVGYMAKRPGAEQRGVHGLFNDSDEPIVLNQVADEVAHHKGNVWSHVVSLRREDAIRLGYDNSDRWRELVKRQIPVIAEQSRIPMSNLKWYAAFHDTTHHPHIHLIVYSTNPKQGYLSREGIDKIRSAFANDIFHDDLQSIYQEQTLSRDELKSISQEQVHQMAMQIQNSTFNNPQLEKLVKKLHEQLQSVSGKKVYGYLPQDVKRTVDDILVELAKDKQVSQLYEKWCELERLKYKIYTQREPELPSLADNKVFKPVKNMIIRAVLNMNMPEPSPYSVPQNDDSDDTAFSDIDNDIFTWSDEDAVEVEFESTNLHIQWSKDYKKACKLYYKKAATDDEKKEAVELLHSEAEKGNVLAIHDLGKVYADDKEKSDAYYKQALNGFLELEPMSQKLQPYLQYRIGKMYCYGMGTEQNYAESFGWFLKSAIAGNKFAQFSLANQYYYGNGFYKDKGQALQWYMKSAEQGLPYAAYAVAQMYANGEAVLQDEATAQQYYAQALAGFLKLEASDRADDNLLYKLGRMYRYVLGTDEDIPKALEYFSRSAKHGNINAKRMIAIEQLSGEQIPCDVNKAVETLKELAENGDAMSAYRLGKLYLFGEDGIERDVPQAIQWLTKSADDDNEYAQELLDNMEQRENAAFASTIFGLFVSLSHAIENDYSKNHKKLQSKVDSKIQQIIRKHKQELGIKEEYGQQTQNY